MLSIQRACYRKNCLLASFLVPLKQPKSEQSLEAKLGQITRADREAAEGAEKDSEQKAVSNGGRVVEKEGDGEEEDSEMGEALTGPLEEAFMSRTEEGEVSRLCVTAQSTHHVLSSVERCFHYIHVRKTRSENCNSSRGRHPVCEVSVC